MLEIDPEKERIGLGMKQLETAPGGQKIVVPTGTAQAPEVSGPRKGEIVTVTVLQTNSGGIEVQVGEDGPIGFIKRADLSRDRDEQKPERFQVGQKLDALVTGFEKGRKPTLSIKAMQLNEDKEAIEKFGSSDSGASLGDILGAALNKARDKR